MKTKVNTKPPATPKAVVELPGQSRFNYLKIRYTYAVTDNSSPYRQTLELSIVSNDLDEVEEKLWHVVKTNLGPESNFSCILKKIEVLN